MYHRHPHLLAKRRHLRQLFQPNLAGANPFVAVHTRPTYGLGVVEMHQFQQRRVLFVNVCHIRQRVLVTARKDVAGVHTDAQPRIIERLDKCDKIRAIRQGFGALPRRCFKQKRARLGGVFKRFGHIGAHRGHGHIVRFGGGFAHVDDNASASGTVGVLQVFDKQVGDVVVGVTEI